MASVLSLRPQSPFKRSFSENPYLRSCSPSRDRPLAVFHDIGHRNASACSLYTMGAVGSADWLSPGENTPPPASRSLLELYQHPKCDLHRTPPPASFQLRPKDDSDSLPHTRIETASESYCRDRNATHQAMDPTCDDNVEAKGPSEGTGIKDKKDSKVFDAHEVADIPSLESQVSKTASIERSLHVEELAVHTQSDPQPFRRWMTTLKRRHVHRRRDAVSDLPLLSTQTKHTVDQSPKSLLQVPDSCRKNSVSSSMAGVVAMASASITIASASIAPRSENAGTHAKSRMENRSSHFSEVRKSTDSNPGTLGPILDESAWLRSVQRRKIVEEIMVSEESYIGDLKVLINDYFMILTSVPTLSAQTRASIQRNISQILHLHEDLLAELHQTVPHADFTQSAHYEPYPSTKVKHIRFHSADMVPPRLAENKADRRLRHSLEIGRSPEHRPQGLAMDTRNVGDLAKVFNKHMKRFFTYEEYGAHWTTMSQDLTSLCKGLYGWSDYERGVEALSKVIVSENNRESSSRKALSFADLLIKPIQRVCKYPLLFEDLCRQTPVCDDPEAHAELEKALFRFQETIREVNKAKDDLKTRRLIEISWQLQDRLVIQEQTLSRASTFRLLGHVLVCGVLHVAYHTPDRIQGQYMVCALYKSCLVIATTTRAFTQYAVVACIGLANSSIEEPDNGRGLQCHTAPHTWKLVFEHGHRLHELMFSACTSHEEETWKHRLRERIISETKEVVEGQATMQDMCSSLNLDVRSIGSVFGHADSLVRRMSVHRAATLGSKTNPTQVIIRNTQAQKTTEPQSSFPPGSIARSQSHVSSNHIPTLAPRRAERIRLETALEDVWTKDILPFPGMGNRRVEDHIRASANSVMRKLSMASIASNFSRRSPSFSSLSNHTRSDESFSSRVHKMSQGNLRARHNATSKPAPAVVDFHSAPAAFLPTDFELEDVRPCSRRRRFANRGAATERLAERPMDRPSPGRPKRARRLSAQLMSLPRTDMNHRIDSRTVSNTSHIKAGRVPENSAESATSSVRFQENQKRRGKDSRERGWTSPRSSSGGGTPTRKFLKNKSRIFKFWM